MVVIHFGMCGVDIHAYMVVQSFKIFWLKAWLWLIAICVFRNENFVALLFIVCEFYQPRKYVKLICLKKLLDWFACVTFVETSYYSSMIMILHKLGCLEYFNNSYFGQKNPTPTRPKNLRLLTTPTPWVQSLVYAVNKCTSLAISITSNSPFLFLGTFLL